ncbi:MAG: peptidoglycan DD-metalloendopeptidase family protein [Bacteroidota bacterium]
MKKSLALLLGVCLLVACFFYVPFPTQNQPPPISSQEESLATEIAATPNIRYGFNLDSLNLKRYILKANESLGAILSRYNVSDAIIARIGQLPKDLFDVRRLRANKPYSLIQNPDSSVALGFVYHPNPMEYIVLNLADSLSVFKGRNQTDTLTHEIGGVIQYSLYESVLEQGGNAALVNQLFEIFAWDLDFWAIHEGDYYKVFYTTYEVEGEFAGFGEIKAALIHHLGEPHYAYRYNQQDGNGWEYFDADGDSRKGEFLRVPLQYTRISSRFTHSRFHPILKRRRPHHGVDFAAPRGTSVYAIGDGTIMKAHYSGGAGNMIKIQHGEGFQSGYLHLSGYAKGIKKGAKVTQGQTIGYVGSTGLSTGPHLDFRLWKNGVPLNPLRLSKPSSEGICEELKEDFQRSVTLLKEKLAAIALPPVENLREESVSEIEMHASTLPES